MSVQKVENKFKVAILAARRAKQIMTTGKKKVEIDASNPLTVALEEIHQGLVNFETLKEEEKNAFISLEGEDMPEEGEISEEQTETDFQANAEADVDDMATEDEEATKEDILKQNLTE